MCHGRDWDMDEKLKGGPNESGDDILQTKYINGKIMLCGWKEIINRSELICP